MDDYIIRNQKFLRYGITTGSCAAAAAKAAAKLLLTGVLCDHVSMDIPSGKRIDVAVSKVSYSDDTAEFMVIKDSGDDPDVTDKAEIHVTLQKSGSTDKNAFRYEGFCEIYLDGGEGIGRITAEGLEQSIGQAAINKVPRQMIFDAVDEIAGLADYRGKLLAVVSVPGGKELSEHTFNPRLGIEGGISVLGTSGILEPMSEKAFADTIELQIKQSINNGNRNIVIVPGNYGEKYASSYAGSAPVIKCGNFIGETLDMAVVYGVKNLLLIGNTGKLIKLAAGIMNTHSLYADARQEIMAVHSVLCGADKYTAQKIMDCITTDEMIGILEKEGIRDRVMHSISLKIQEHVRRRLKDSVNFGVMLFSEKYGFLCQTEGTDSVTEAIRGKV